MEADLFVGTLGAVILGNALTLIYVYALWRASKHERERGSLDGLPFYVLFAGILGPVIGGVSILYAVNL